MARAAETTLSGTMVCAKCTLKKADATKCQDVLVVKDDKGASTEYYIAKNAAADEAGHQCKKEAKATVTGTVSEKDGKKWIEASRSTRKRRSRFRRQAVGRRRAPPRTPSARTVPLEPSTGRESRRPLSLSPRLGARSRPPLAAPRPSP